MCNRWVLGSRWVAIASGLFSTAAGVPARTPGWPQDPSLVVGDEAGVGPPSMQGLQHRSPCGNGAPQPPGMSTTLGFEHLCGCRSVF